MGERKDKGKIIVRKSKKGKWIFEVDIGTKQPMVIPTFYDLKDDSLNDKECEVIRENGQIKKILVDGKELPRKQSQTHQDIGRNNKPKKSNSYEDMFNMNKTKTAKDVKQILSSTYNIENFNLLLNKFAQFERDKFFFYKTDKRTEIYKINADFTHIDFKRHSEDYKEKLEKLDLEINSCTFQPDWRLIVGLGGESVYETSITLHHIYGFPYIPGQAVKGVVRSYFIKTEFEKIGTDWSQINIFEKVLENLDLEKDKKLNYEDVEKNDQKIKGFKNKFSIKGNNASEKLYMYFFENFSLKKDAKALIEKFRAIFGTQSQQGEAIFFDAYPKTPPNIKIDVMNPHYADYYSGKTPPADYLNPVPIYFLTVEDTDFEFFIGCKKEIKHFYLTETEELLREALTKHGIGAKTAVGYGYMSPSG